MKYTSTILSIAVHPENDNPVFGEGSTHIRIEDEAGGPFIVLSQSRDDSQSGEIRLDFEEVEMITDVIYTLKTQPVIQRLLNESNPNTEV